VHLAVLHDQNAVARESRGRGQEQGYCGDQRNEHLVFNG
jgi:hypothetical protein